MSLHHIPVSSSQVLAPQSPHYLYESQIMNPSLGQEHLGGGVEFWGDGMVGAFFHDYLSTAPPHPILPAGTPIGSDPTARLKQSGCDASPLFISAMI